MSAITHPAVMAAVISRAFPSSGGGGARRGVATSARVRGRRIRRDGPRRDVSRPARRP